MGSVRSDVDLAHSTGDLPEHALANLDRCTHADEIRGYLRFETWGACVEGARLHDEDLVELTLGPTVRGRVRFSPRRDRR